MPVESNNSFVSSVTGYKMVTLKTKETTNIYLLTSFSDHMDVRLSGWIMIVPEYLASLKHLEQIHKRERKPGLTMH